VGGLLLGLCFATRFQLAPALLVMAIGCCRLEARAWGLVIAGGVAGLAIDGAIDALHGLVPFGWMIENFRLNLIENRSANYGVEPASWFVTEWVRLWGVMALPVLALAIWGARRQPVLLAVALVNLLAHSLIAHKEYRFVLLSEILLILLAAICTAEAIRWALARRPRWRVAIAGAAGLFWLGGSVAVAISPAGGDVWSSNKKSIRQMRAEHAIAEMCGMAYFQPEPDRLVAHYYVDRPVRIYYFDGDGAYRDVRAAARAFNVVAMTPDRAWQLGPAYRPAGCYGGAKGDSSLPLLDGRCLFVRAGGCTPLPTHAFDVNAALERRKE
jgi:hypothetical protein